MQTTTTTTTKLIRITNGGHRVAPQSPTCDSGRNSWSTASIVSTIDAQSPEPNVKEQADQPLQQTAPTSSIKKYSIIGTGVGLVCLIILGIILGTVLTRTPSNQPLIGSTLLSTTNAKATTTTLASVAVTTSTSAAVTTSASATVTIKR